MSPDSELRASEPDVLLFERSPDGSLDALVQSDGRTVYLYLNDPDGTFGTRACWVRNLIPAPLELSQADLQQQAPPVMPRFFTNHPHGAPLPRSEDLRIVWLEEGNGIALRERDQLLAVIPPWSGREGFHGYARDCLSENEICWPLPAQPTLLERIDRAVDFWSACQAPEYVASLDSKIRDVYRARFGDATQSYQVDPDGWPPVQILRHDSTLGPILTSCGMGLRPQPNVELTQKKPAAMRRIELGLVAARAAFGTDESQAVELLAGQVRYPWRHWTWLGHGHLSKLLRPNAEPWQLLFISERPWQGELLRFRGDPVHLLWMVPMNEDDFKRTRTDLAGLIEDCVHQGRVGFSPR